MEREEAKSSASALRAAVIAVRDATATKLMILFSEKPFVRQFPLIYRGIIAAENRLGKRAKIITDSEGDLIRLQRLPFRFNSGRRVAFVINFADDAASIPVRLSRELLSLSVESRRSTFRRERASKSRA